MPNKTYALEWLHLANRNFETARLLLRENHFTDSIAIEIHQSIEKAFKSIVHFMGKAFPGHIPFLSFSVLPARKSSLRKLILMRLLQSVISMKQTDIRGQGMWFLQELK